MNIRDIWIKKMIEKQEQEKRDKEKAEINKIMGYFKC